MLFQFDSNWLHYTTYRNWLMNRSAKNRHSPSIWSHTIPSNPIPPTANEKNEMFDMSLELPVFVLTNVLTRNGFTGRAFYLFYYLIFGTWKILGNSTQKFAYGKTEEVRSHLSSNARDMTNTLIHTQTQSTSVWSWPGNFYSNRY